MFKLKRNQVIITVLVVMIVAVGYLNHMENQRAGELVDGFTYNQENSIEAIMAQENGLEDSVPADLTITPPAPISISELLDLNLEEVELVDFNEAEYVSALADDGTFFVQARLAREQDRARQREMSLDLIGNEDVTEEIRATAAEAMLTMQRRIEKESQAESLIKSRGFNEVYVRIGENSVDVIVNKDVLTDAELAQIEDVIKRKVGVDSSDIRIAPLVRNS